MHSKNSAHKIPAAVLMLSLLVTLLSCSTILEDTTLSTLTGAAVGAGLGAAVDSNNRGRGAAIGGAAGGAFGFMLAKQYQATHEQIILAELRAAIAARKDSTKKKMAQNRTRYVAVPVKPSGDQKKSGAKNLIMVYDTESWDLVSEKAHVPTKSTYKEGDVATFGGKKTIISTGFSGF